MSTFPRIQPNSRGRTDFKAEFLFGPHVHVPADKDIWFAEAVRVIVWLNTIAREKERLSISTASVTGGLKRMFPWIYDDLDPEIDNADDPCEAKDGVKPQTRQILEELEYIGDVLECQESNRWGMWRPCPLKCIDMGSKLGNQIILSGGMPTHLLPPSWQRVLRFEGHIRRMPTGLPSDDTGKNEWWFSVPFEEWLGPKPSSLRSTYDFFYSAPLISLSGTVMKDIKVYHADLANDRQVCKWHMQSGLHDGRYLVRHHDSYGKKSFAIGLYEHGQFIKMSENLPMEYRRLLYALDDHAGKRMTAKKIAQRDGYCYQFSSELPAYERRALMFLGTFQPNSNGFYYPRCYHIPAKNAENVDRLLKELQIMISTM